MIRTDEKHFKKLKEKKLLNNSEKQMVAQSLLPVYG